MVIIYVLLVILAAALAAVFFSQVHLSFLFDTVIEEMSCRARWLGFLSAEGTVTGGRVRITVRLWELRVYSGFLKRGGKKGSMRSMLDSLALSGTRARFTYGSNEPHRTGLFCAAGEFIRLMISMVNPADIEIEPVFLPQEEFLTVEAETRLNIGKTLMNLIAARFHIKRTQRRRAYGSAELNE